MMELVRDSLIWLIILCGVAALIWWVLETFVPLGTFRNPIRIVFGVIIAVVVIYLLFSILSALAPPFPGR